MICFNEVIHQCPELGSSFPEKTQWGWCLYAGLTDLMAISGFIKIVASLSTASSVHSTMTRPNAAITSDSM